MARNSLDLFRNSVDLCRNCKKLLMNCKVLFRNCEDLFADARTEAGVLFASIPNFTEFYSEASLGFEVSPKFKKKKILEDKSPPLLFLSAPLSSRPGEGEHKVLISLSDIDITSAATFLVQILC